MKNYHIAFEILDRGENYPISFKYSTCNILLDVKMGLTKKERYFAWEDITDHHSSITYAIIVSRGSVIIYFLISALNDLDIIAGNINNANFNNPKKIRFSSMQVMNGSMIKVK